MIFELKKISSVILGQNIKNLNSKKANPGAKIPQKNLAMEMRAGVDFET